MYYLEVSSGRKWHYDLKGEGQPLLFIHGWGVDLRIWRQQIKYFSRSRRVLAIDLPGHGKSPWSRVALEDMARDIYEIVQRFGFKQTHVAASSFGGLVALTLYEFFPAIFRSLVLIGAPPKFVRSPDYPYGLKLEETGRLASQLKKNYPAVIQIFFRSLFTREERQTRRFKWIQTFRKADVVPDQEALFHLLMILEKADLRDVFRRLDIPVQFLNGEEDYFFPAPLREHVKKLLPQAGFHGFEHCGHFPFLIWPQEFNHVLEGFLNTVEN